MSTQRSASKRALPVPVVVVALAWRVGELRHVFPQPVLVQPDGIGARTGELLRRESLNKVIPANALLPAIEKDGRVLGAQASLLGLLCRGEFALGFWHGKKQFKVLT